MSSLACCPAPRRKGSTRIPMASARRATALPISPKPITPMVCPATATVSNWSQMPASWLRTIRRNPLAKNRTAPIANSPRISLKTPRALVNGTGLSASSGNKRSSSPAERECTQRTRGVIRQTCRSSSRLPVQFRMISASGAAWANASTRSPTAIRVFSGSASSMASNGSVGSANTKTVLSPMRSKLPCSTSHWKCRGRGNLPAGWRVTGLERSSHVS